MQKKIAKNNNFSKIIKVFISIACIVLICVLFYFILKWSGALDRFDSVEEISEIIKSYGIYGIIIFFILQFLQVTILPLPSFITTVAGSLVFGPLASSITSTIAIILGSVFSFFLGRKFGTKLLSWCVGEEDTKKYKAILTECKYAFFLMMLFPLFPDDILCLVAGVTNMSFKFFLITNLITRPIGIICTCFLGSGYLIPFKGWGTYAWILIGILLVVSFLITSKYQENIEKFLINLNKKTFKKSKRHTKK